MHFLSCFVHVQCWQSVAYAGVFSREVLVLQFVLGRNAAPALKKSLSTFLKCPYTGYACISSYITNLSDKQPSMYGMREHLKP